MGNKELDDATVKRDTVTSHAKRQRLTRIDLSQDPNVSFPKKEQIESLLNEARKISARKESNKRATRRRLNR